MMLDGMGLVKPRPLLDVQSFKFLRLSTLFSLLRGLGFFLLLTSSSFFTSGLGGIRQRQTFTYFSTTLFLWTSMAGGSQSIIALQQQLFVL
jgi:hypothetical protein